MVVGDHDGVVMCFGMKKGEAVVCVCFEYSQVELFLKHNEKWVEGSSDMQYETSGSISHLLAVCKTSLTF